MKRTVMHGPYIIRAEKVNPNNGNISIEHYRTKKRSVAIVENGVLKQQDKDNLSPKVVFRAIKIFKEM